MLVPTIVPLAAAASARADHQDRILCEIRFGNGPPDPGTHLQAHVPLQQLGPTARELWIGDGPVSRGEAQEVSFACDGQRLMGVIELPATASVSGFEAQIESAYERLTTVAAAAGFPHLLRIWNYFADISKPTGELDRYQQFCRARYQPLVDHCQQYGDGFPSATAIGCRGEQGVVLFLAANRPGRHQENPRQVSAYDYPPRYGPRSPSFARATLVEGPPAVLLISGTASILGHESRHLQDLPAQFAEALRNVDAVIRASGEAHGVTLRGATNLTHAKVYLRDRNQVPQLERQMAEAWRALPVLLIEGDPCRRELLLEIEGVAASAPLSG